MYESPISLKIEQFVDNVQRATQNQIFYKVREIVDVDREELIRALKYDRDQYYKGFKDGKRAAWISVKERLPEKDEEVIVCVQMENGMLYVTSAELWDDGLFWTDSGPLVSSMYEVTHWMPLPEPPEVEE